MTPELPPSSRMVEEALSKTKNEITVEAGLASTLKYAGSPPAVDGGLRFFTGSIGEVRRQHGFWILPPALLGCHLA